MLERSPQGLLKLTLVTLLLATPPVSDAVEQRGIPLEHEKDGEIMRIVSEGWRKGTIDAAFLLNKNLESRALDVSVNEETAILSGTVGAAVNKSLAQEIALSVEGINKVINKIHVTPKDETKLITTPKVTRNKEDVLLTSKINQKLLTHQHLSAALINVHTNNGMVELSGNSPSDSAKDLAYYLAKNVSGVKSVDNKIKVRLSI